MIRGPREPHKPIGPARESARTFWGLVFKHQEFKDGWIYELALPMDRPQPLYPRPELIRIFTSAYMIGAFEENYVNYLTWWMPRELHKEVLPEGPPEYRYYAGDADRAEAQRAFEEWMELGRRAGKAGPEPRDTGPIKLVELAELVSGQAEEDLKAA
jgi:hypothetical protein